MSRGALYLGRPPKPQPHPRQLHEFVKQLIFNQSLLPNVLIFVIYSTEHLIRSLYDIVRCDLFILISFKTRPERFQQLFHVLFIIDQQLKFVNSYNFNDILSDYIFINVSSGDRPSIRLLTPRLLCRQQSFPRTPKVEWLVLDSDALTMCSQLPRPGIQVLRHRVRL